MSGAKLGENIEREWREESRASELWDALQLVKTDPAAGVDTLEQLAYNGSCLAKMYLGEIHLKGEHGVPPDREVGERWLRQSAEDGSIEGAYGLAWHLLRTGRVDEAFGQYSGLGERGYSPAFYALGAHFYKGEVVERSLDKALHFFLRGAALGHLHAAVWASRVLMRREMGFRKQCRGFADWITLLRPLLQTAWSYPNSDRLRIR
jgi:TPR repeat protein